MNSSNNRVKKDIVVPLLVLATILAGMVSSVTLCMAMEMRQQSFRLARA